MPFHDGAFIHIPIARLLHLTLSCAERWFAFPDLYSWIPAAIIGDEIAPFETSPCTIPQRRATIPCEEATVHGTRDALEIAVALGFRARGWPAYYGENDWICNALNSRYLEGRSIPLEDAALPVVSFSSGYEAERISTFLRSRCGEEVFDLIRKASTDEFGRQVGYPDIVLAGDSFILCEVKRKNEKLRDSQAGAIANLLSSGVRVEIIRCSFVNGPGT